MKERPILMSTEMVKAILEGRKSQTRRICKPQPVYDEESGHVFIGNMIFDIHDGWDIPMYLKDIARWEPGDRLWVRETWFNDMAFGAPEYCYRADGEFNEQFDRHRLGEVGPFKWKPSIFMPREACRIILEVADVRVERLQDITDDDAKAEGIDYVIDKITGYCGRDYLSGGYNLMTTPYHGYRSLWESINGKGSWEKNPWVWVITFRKIEP